MKKVISLVAVSALSISVNFSAQASVEEALSNICDVVKTNDKSTLRKKMRSVQSDYKLRLNAYYEGVSCGGKTMIRFALENDANDVGVVMVKKLSKKLLAQTEDLQWAEANGYSASVITQEMKSRLGV